MDKWRPVLTHSGQVFINGNNIVMEHIESKYTYLLNSKKEYLLVNPIFFSQGNRIFRKYPRE